jgi:hypothetical protein
MKTRYSIVSAIAIVGILTFWTALAVAQPADTQNEPQAQAPAAQSQSAPAHTDGGAGKGMMGDKGMMCGNKCLMGMPMMMSCCPCAMMRPGMMGPMMGAGKDTKTAARMMEMHAEMMKASAAIMEKYAKEMENEK